MLDYCQYCREEIHWCYSCEVDDHNGDNPQRTLLDKLTGDVEHYHNNCLHPEWAMHYEEVL